MGRDRVRRGQGKAGGCLFDHFHSFILLIFVHVFTSWIFLHLIPLLIRFLLVFFSETIFFCFSFSSQKKIHTHPKVVAGRVWLGWHRGMHISVVFFGAAREKEEF